MINQRIFSANVGDSSVGNAGPDAIEQDIDNLLANDQELLGTLNDHETQINTLDAQMIDYEEGNFTPFFLPENGELDISYLTQRGRYRKIGDLIFITMVLTPSSTAIGTATGYLRIGGLPFVPSERSALTIGNFRRFNTSIDSKDARAAIFDTSEIMLFLQAASAYNLKELSVTDLFEGSGTYNQLIISGLYLI